MNCFMKRKLCSENSLCDTAPPAPMDAPPLFVLYFMLYVTVEIKFHEFCKILRGAVGSCIMQYGTLRYC